jgi:hypothetical protein
VEIGESGAIHARRRHSKWTDRDKRGRIMKRTILVGVAVLVIGFAVGLSADGLKWKAKAPGAQSQGQLQDKVVASERVTLPHDSDPLRSQFEPKNDKARATAALQYDDGAPNYRSLFLGTTPTYFWGNTFTNPGTGTFTVAAVTPWVNVPASPGAGWPCTGQTVSIGDGVVTVAIVHTGTAGTIGVGFTSYTTSGFVTVPFTGATVTAANSQFVAGHLIDATDCMGTPGTTNHWGELVWVDLTATGGGSGTGMSNAFTPGVGTSQGFIGTRTVFTRAVIVGPNVPVELSRFTVE